MQAHYCVPPSRAEYLLRSAQHRVILAFYWGIGFALTIGVLADAFLVRMTIVPALMSIVGERIWWLPAWLDRLLPDVDIEGESLMRRLGEETRPPVTAPSAV